MSDILGDVLIRERLEAAAFRHLVAHLQARSDVQNVDLMGVGGFCRNCLGDWLAEAAEAEGLSLDKAAARAAVYGMPQAEWKAKFQTEATAEQLARMEESLQRNAAMRADGHGA